MDGLRQIPFYKRFAFKVLIINCILISAVLTPLWFIGEKNYKNLSDRLGIHKRLFDYILTQFEEVSPENCRRVLSVLPAVLPGQRLMLFNEESILVADSGASLSMPLRLRYQLIFPHPYIDPENISHNATDDLLKIIGSDSEYAALDFSRKQQGMLNVRKEHGMDRLFVTAREVYLNNDEWRLVVMASSVVDILIQRRAEKERFLITFILILILAAILTFQLSRSVMVPFRRLYSAALDILNDPRGNWELPEDLANRNQENIRNNETGRICKALQRIIREQHRQAENFRRFSSDVVHELKTPLTAIRSGLELYSESDDQEEKETIYERINRRIQQMEGLMNEIEQLGKLESPVKREQCSNVSSIFLDLADQYHEAELTMYIGNEINGALLPLSSENFRKVVQNLIDNAVSFSPGKGSVTISAYIRKSGLQITVEDNGPGIAPEAMETITRRFFSFRSSGKRGHSGLGLSIASAILTGCGGTLAYENRQEGGARFSVKIPVES